MRINSLASVIIVSASLASAQQNSTISNDVSRALAGMHARTWTEREAAFKQSPPLAEVEKKNSAAAEHLKLGFIQLLIEENADVHRAKQTGTRFTSEEHSEYYGNLIATVASLNDERTIPALLGAITTGGMAMRGLAKFGDQGLDPVLSRLEDPDPRVRASISFTLRDMLRFRTIKRPQSGALIRETLRSFLDDPEFGVRDSAISAVEYIDNREEFVPLLERLASNDPVALPGKPDDGGDGGHFYPVRQHARRLLRRIANHEPPPGSRDLPPK